MSRKRNLVAAAAALALMGCAAPVTQTQHVRVPGVEPVQSVRHGMTADMLYRTGRYFQGLARFTLAERAYEAALRVDPTHVDALNALGVICSQTNRPNDAEQAFQRALQIEPNAARVYNNLGYHLLRSGRATEAVTHLERARALDPANGDVEANLALARSSAGSLAAAAANVTAPESSAGPAAATAPPGTEQAPGEVPGTQDTVAAAAADAPAPVAVAAPGGPTANQTVAAAHEATSPDSGRSLGASALAVAKPEGAPRGGPQFEVSNGNGRSGLARRVSDELASLGAPTARLTNNKPFGARSSAIHYVTGAERMAQDINARLRVPLPLAPVAALERDVRVRVLLGKDFAGAPPEFTAAVTNSTRQSAVR